LKYEDETKVKSYTIKSQGKKKDTRLRWNFAMGILHGTFFSGGRAFGNPDIILPIFLSNFSASKILVGFSSSIFGSLGGIAGILPQIFVASRLENKVYKRPVLLGTFVSNNIFLCYLSFQCNSFFSVLFAYIVYFYGWRSNYTIYGHLG